jgi:hypothetical protein
VFHLALVSLGQKQVQNRPMITLLLRELVLDSQLFRPYRDCSKKAFSLFVTEMYVLGFIGTLFLY